MTVENLIQQQATRNSSSSHNSSSEESDYTPESAEDDALFRMYHLKGYANGPGFKIESF